MTSNIYLKNKKEVENIINDYKKVLSYEKSADSKQGIKAKAKTGLFTGSTAPYGYYVSNGSLYIKDDETPNIVRRIFKEYISGKGFDSIAKGLHEDNIPTPRNKGSKWHGSSVRSILENPHYTGSLVQSRTETLQPASTERIIKDESEYIVVENTHEKIISLEDFNLVKDMINNRKRKKPVTQKHIFSNLIYCKECGKSMNYKKHIDAFLCGSYVKHGKKGCEHNKTIKMDIVKSYVSDLLNVSELTPDILNKKLIEINICKENKIDIVYRTQK